MSERPNPAESERPDEIDALLKDAMAASPPPALPPTFTNRVTARLRPRRLHPGARRLWRLYTLAAALAVPAAIGRLLPWRSR